jgi:hypothetical protein
MYIRITDNGKQCVETALGLSKGGNIGVNPITLDGDGRFHTPNGNAMSHYEVLLEHRNMQKALYDINVKLSCATTQMREIEESDE